MLVMIVVVNMSWAVVLHKTFYLLTAWFDWTNRKTRVDQPYGTTSISSPSWEKSRYGKEDKSSTL